MLEGWYIYIYEFYKLVIGWDRRGTIAFSDDNNNNDNDDDDNNNN